MFGIAPDHAFCDWLTTSHPLDAALEVRTALQPVLDATGFQQDFTDLKSAFFRSIDATVHMSTRHGVFIVSVSGKACEQLRTYGGWGELLATLGSWPHRVTMLHATLETDEHGPAAIAAVLERARRGEIDFTRKSITAQDVRAFLGTDLRGQVTGTAYLGKKHADVQGVVYDKRHEQEQRGLILDGPMTRYEMRIRSGMGPTLHDAFEPTPIFWHFAGRSLRGVPDGVQPWAPRAEGFTMPDRMIFTAAELMARKLDCSPDVDRLLDLAIEAGPHGIDLLCSRLRNRLVARALAPRPSETVEALRAVPSAIH